MRLQNKDDYLKRAAAIPNCLEEVLLVKLICLLGKILTGIFVASQDRPLEVGPVLIRDHTVFNPVQAFSYSSDE